jgi:hypothetical protein
MMQPKLRTAILGLCMPTIILGLLWLVWWYRSPAGVGTLAWGMPGSHDFVEYWSAAQLWLQGGNPYDPSALFKVEQTAGWPESVPLRMWNPPWTLPLMLPLAGLPLGIAAVIWFVLGCALLVGSARLLWNVTAPGDGHYRVAVWLSIGFLPTLTALQMGQIGLWLLFGIAGFLYSVHRRWDFSAGCALALLMIKPHLTYLLLLAALWWMLRERRLNMVAGWVASLGVASGLALVWAPDVFFNYAAAAVASPPPYATPTLGTYVGLLIDPNRPWLRLLPSILSGLGLLVWLWRRRGPWRWPDVASPLLLVSVPTAVYGWGFDHVVLLPVVIGLVASLRTARTTRKLVVLSTLMMFQLLLVVQNGLGVNDMFFVWYPLALAGLYWWTHGRFPRDEVRNRDGLDTWEDKRCVGHC